jgi:hypothetical protein
VGPQGTFSEGQQADIDTAFASMLVRYNTAVYVDKPADVIKATATFSDEGGRAGLTDAVSDTGIKATKRSGATKAREVPK